MASHSKDVILAEMKKASVRFDWGALLALDRSVINVLLREQFLEALGDFGALDPLAVEAGLDIAGALKISFKDLTFGAPQVNFETASEDQTNLTLRLPVIAGEYCLVEHAPGAPRRVLQSGSLTEGMDRWVQAQLPITLQQLNSSRYTSLILDLACASRFTTNLGPTEYAKQMIGERLREPISYLPAYKRKLVLARFKVDDYYPLSADRVIVRTMAAPWSKESTDDRKGDGAVMLFMKLGTDLYGGKDDLLRVLLYPIPEEAIGLPGTLILDPAIRGLGAGAPLDVLNTLQLSNGYTFHLTDTYLPLDHVFFGDWKRSEKTLTVEPAMATVVSGKSQAFTVKGASGAVQWSASNWKRAGATGTFQNATYHPRGVAEFAADQQRVLITATSVEAGVEVQRHALLMETVSAVQVSPRVATWAQGNAPIEFSAATADGGTLKWSLAGAVRLLSGERRTETTADLGKLEDLGNGKARFTPAEPLPGSPDLRFQRIKVVDAQSGESAECAVAIINWPARYELEPFHVAQMQSVQPVAFKADTKRPVTWRVYGEGSIDKNGLYTPPDQPKNPIAVVAADDGDEGTGYTIVELIQGRKPSASLMSWTAISTFEVKAISAPKCFANGWQQIEVEVAVAASDGSGGETIEISDADLATLQLWGEGDNDPLVFLESDEEFLDPALNRDWAVSLTENTIDHQPATAGESGKPSGTIRRRRFFIHCRKAGVKTIHATIQNAETFRIISSENMGEAGKLKLTGEALPSFTQQSYSFVRTRVAGDESPSDGDEYAYVDNSTDYWRLEHALRDNKLVKFERLRIRSRDNKSSVLWSSNLRDDRFCSYTGFSFNAARGNSLDRLLFDGLLYQMAKQREHTLPKLLVDHKPGAGQLTLSVHRVDNFMFDDGTESGLPYIRALQKALLLELIDTEGNAHRLRFVFGVSVDDKQRGIVDRDKILLDLQ